MGRPKLGSEQEGSLLQIESGSKRTLAVPVSRGVTCFGTKQTTDLGGRVGKSLKNKLKEPTRRRHKGGRGKTPYLKKKRRPPTTHPTAELHNRRKQAARYEKQKTAKAPSRANRTTARARERKERGLRGTNPHAKLPNQPLDLLKSPTLIEFRGGQIDGAHPTSSNNPGVRLFTHLDV